MTSPRYNLRPPRTLTHTARRLTEGTQKRYVAAEQEQVVVVVVMMTWSPPPWWNSVRTDSGCNPVVLEVARTVPWGHGTPAMTRTGRSAAAPRTLLGPIHVAAVVAVDCHRTTECQAVTGTTWASAVGAGDYSSASKAGEGTKVALEEPASAVVGEAVAETMPSRYVRRARWRTRLSWAWTRTATVTMTEVEPPARTLGHN